MLIRIAQKSACVSLMLHIFTNTLSFLLLPHCQINFSQRNLGYRDAELLRDAILANPQLGVLKLSYNNLGNIGTNLIASAIKCGGGLISSNESSLNFAVLDDGDKHSQGNETCHSPIVQNRQYQHHPSLSVLDLGFNNVGDEGCLSLASLAVAHNPILSTLYLAGNAIKEQGSVAIADAIAGGCGLTTLHLTANQIGPQGVKGIMRSIAEFDVTLQMAQQDRENRMALEEERMKRKGQSHVKGEILCPIHSNDEQNDETDDLARLQGLKCIEEMYLGGTKMESTGCLSVSNMLLTNLSLRVLCLSDNGLNDQDLSLFSQSLSRNKQLPLEVLRLSFNKLTCVGVETLMNAIWGSKTLREIKLDNNQIRDRGAQLAAVVLTSVDLEVLDIGFNRLTIVGIKALMKSLAENSSLLALTLSGNVLDTNASKAVSYALAYNRTIRKLYLDHCSLSYAAQRHIAAGIVSNSYLALRVMSGFPLGGKLLLKE
jgi:Ran GTPase-activating protein (RanGAP) involved in mRNA processing and transport